MARFQPFKQAQDYLPRLRAVFFARWDEDRGCEITYQVPEGSVGVLETGPRPRSTSLQPAGLADDGSRARTSETLLEFADVRDFVLPKKHLCGHLVTVATERAKILGYPILIEDETKYERNFLMFNLCFVFDREAELAGFEPAARKTGRTLRSFEQTLSLISAPDSPLEVKSMLEGLFEELNSFSELSISFGPCRTLDLKLFPFYGNPARVEDWEVPVALAPLKTLRNEVTWDLTMFKLVPFIDGVASVQKIAKQADVDLYLTRECMQHLVFYGCCIMTDSFRFSNCYTLVGGPALNALGDSENPESQEMQEELEAYIELAPDTLTIPISDLLTLYTKFWSGVTVHDWMEQNQVHKLPIDVRRFVSFGTIKGFLKRLHCYPVWALHPDITRGSQPTRSQRAGPLDPEHKTHRAILEATLSSSRARYGHPRGRPSAIREPAWLVVMRKLEADECPPTSSNTSKPSKSRRGRRSRANAVENETSTPEAVDVPLDLPLKLDGTHHLDALCVQYQISLTHLEQMLRYIDALSLEEANSTERAFNEASAMQTIYY
ncbi:hypothetical protein CROQUDRAFT_110589 [Cronartium quercuum f. sp. fusiforme G11]|uniref:Nitrogen permease regulator 2 n=1 Tax=Cronartium quercuum f. sp. fusiforme G11 TaxID=708437 RepID=A0A9P6NC10_9BASI|nr:hypothetical protein CROQUDRAFT_110589 [Cronartium quercuum f. sp. fusiforme G11]